MSWFRHRPGKKYPPKKTYPIPPVPQQQPPKDTQ
jgi:hypothetical protein